MSFVSVELKREGGEDYEVARWEMEGEASNCRKCFTRVETHHSKRDAPRGTQGTKYPPTAASITFGFLVNFF